MKVWKVVPVSQGYTGNSNWFASYAYAQGWTGPEFVKLDEQVKSMYLDRRVAEDFLRPHVEEFYEFSKRDCIEDDPETAQEFVARGFRELRVDELTPQQFRELWPEEYSLDAPRRATTMWIVPWTYSSDRLGAILASVVEVNVIETLSLQGTAARNAEASRKLKDWQKHGFEARMAAAKAVSEKQ